MQNMTVAEFVACFLAEKHTREIFGISGAGNIRLLDAIQQRKNLRIVCQHHEQASVMSATTYHRLTRRPGVVTITAGPGACNTITGIANAYLDSLPVIIIAGQEKSEFMDPADRIRGKGVQGLDMVSIVKPITKYAACLRDPSLIRYHLEMAFKVAYSGRPGPVWLEIPQDIQSVRLDPLQLVGIDTDTNDDEINYDDAAKNCIELVKNSKRPLIWVGHGVRLAQCESEFKTLIEMFKIPILTSWQAIDLIPDSHPLNFGRAGTYGQRAANFILQNCDLLIALGTRLAIPQRGYADKEFAPKAKKIIVEIDPLELKKFKMHIDLPILGDVGKFLKSMLKKSSEITKIAACTDWVKKCTDLKNRYPYVIEEHRKAEPGYVNSYIFIDKLSNFLRSDDIIVTDMGTSLTCTHQTLRIKDGQRLMTSTGLGEMGFGLPGAIGAALGAPHRRIIFVGTEGSLMMNLQEIQTVIHHKLPIHFFILNNDCYLTIKHTERAVLDGRVVAATPETGVSFPNLINVAQAFGLDTVEINDESEIDTKLSAIFQNNKFVFCNVKMSPEQLLGPKSALARRDDGSIYSPPLDDLYPFLNREDFAKNIQNLNEI